MTYRMVSIVLPVYNQADHIERIVQEYGAALTNVKVEHEILLVVNGSRDGSLEVCQDLATRVPDVRVLATELPGWGRAVRQGLQASQGDLLCFTNSARTGPEHLVLLLLYALAFPGVVVKANRKIRDNWRRRLGSLIYNLECRALFDLSQWDINGTPKVFPRTCAKLLELSRDDDLIDLEFNALCRREEYPMVEVPVFSTRRHGGESTTNYGSALKMYRGAFELWRSMNAGSDAAFLPAKR